MRERLFSLTDSFTIRNEAGDDVFAVRGKLFSFGKQLSFEDMNGNDLVYIQQKILTFRPTYEIYRNGHLFATVKRELFSFLRHRFTVDVPGPDDLEVAGDLLDHEYTFERSGRVAAQVSKHWFSFGDSYGVDIVDGEDDVLILAAAVVVDMVCHEDRD